MAGAVLGISAYYHDSAAAIVVEGQIIAAAQEERFSRNKHDAGFPVHAIRYVMEESGQDPATFECVVFYDKPFIKFERLLETYHAFAPKGLVSFINSIPVWIKEKVFMKSMLKKELKMLGIPANIPVLFSEHHLSHAASAFYPSPFEEAAIITIDGVGEWATTTICKGRGSDIEILEELHFPHSLGLLYSAFTYYTGFRVNSGEYKLMGLAPYGDPHSPQTAAFRNKTLESLVDIRNDGSILLNMKYFSFATGSRMTHDKNWTTLFGLPPRIPETEISQDYMNMALAIQQVTEDIIIKLAIHAKKLTGCRYLTLAGGVALNCVANGKILESKLFDDIWIQPAAGDAGGALGAALAAWHICLGKQRITKAADGMNGSLLGPEFNESEIVRAIKKYEAIFVCYQNEDQLFEKTASLIDAGNVVGWFQGRMEFGPRALGNRSILGDARNPEMQKKLNLKIKYREGFRPFAPAVLEDDISEYFELDRKSPYMLLVAPVNERRRKAIPSNKNELSLLQRLYLSRSDIPAVTHIDYSARIQSVDESSNPRFYKLLKKFREKTGYGLLVNTSFNVRGEPIVCSPDDAYRCFMSTEMDYLVMGNFLFDKKEQPQKSEFIKTAKGLD
jgi:carbamoyltransferase